MIWRSVTSMRVPITLSVPALVAVLMIVVGTAASQIVLDRLISFQERQLQDLTGAYLDGLESALIEPVLREDSWEVFDALDRARMVYAAVRPVETLITGPTDIVLASSDPRHAPIGSPLWPGFPADATSRSGSTAIVIRADDRTAFASRALVVEGRTIGRIYAQLDITPMLSERSDVLWTLIYSNAALTIGLAAFGWFLVRRMVAPMTVLLEHVSSASNGDVVPIPDRDIRRQSVELARLFQGFNRMAAASEEREALLARIADEERLASLGRLASSVAHEINNPLGGILNAVDTVRVHGADERVRAGAIDLIDRGLRGMRDVVRSILATYRQDRESRDLGPADLQDLMLLIRPEIRRKQVTLKWSSKLPQGAPVNAFSIRQVVLNLLLNACRAVPGGGTVSLAAELTDRSLVIEVSDSGPGLPAALLEVLQADDHASYRLAGMGLGLWTTQKIVRELRGTLTPGTSSFGGARFRVEVPLSVPAPKEIEVVA